MKLIFTILFSGFVLILFGQNIPEGTYMSFGGGAHVTVTKPDDNTVLITPCLKYESQLSAQNETYSFSKLSGTEKFGWEGGSQVILNYENNTLVFPEPVNMNNERSYKWMHGPGNTPKDGVKTYRDETIGGYSKARILVENESEIKTENCLIHSAEKNDLNNYVLGSFQGVFNSNWNANFQSDYTGTFLGLPMRWSLVSDENGEIIKWGSEEQQFLVFFIMVEFENELPPTIDPVEAGKKVAGIYSALYIGAEGYVEIHQMQKRM